jgi:hypothetical protein
VRTASTAGVAASNKELIFGALFLGSLVHESMANKKMGILREMSPLYV